MTKAAIIISAILVFAGVAAASSLPGIGGGSNGTPTLDTPPLASTSTGTTTTGDVRREDRRAGDDNRAGEDLRGPCDEAEHANDPRCTGVQGQRGDDNQNHDANDDRGGPNRGPDGSSGGGNSGHGGGGEDD
jgi:hypothetical protein